MTASTWGGSKPAWIPTVPQSAYDVANWIYVWGHWPVIILTMLWLVLHHRDVFLRLRDGMLVSGALGLVVFVTYPVAPPRLVDPELIDTVTARSEAYRYLQPPNFVNQYAALPSRAGDAMRSSFRRSC